MEQRKCDECKKTIEDKRGRVSRKRRSFCDKTCYGRFYSKRQAEKRTPVVKVPTKCEGCGIVFTPYHNGQKACGPKCNIKRQQHRQREESKIIRDDKTRCASPYCQMPFEPISYNQQYCSRKCYRREAQARYRIKYPKKDIEGVRKRKWHGNWWRALQRDKFTCQLCKFTKGSGKWSGLVVHHLDGEGDTGGKNHVLSNLQTLCIQCHTKLHRGVLLVRKEGILFVKFDGKYMEVIENDALKRGM